MCWWPAPNTKNIKSLIIKRAEPDIKTWILHPINIDKYCGKNILHIITFQIYFLIYLIYVSTLCIFLIL